MNQVVGMVEAKSKLAELAGQVKYGGKRFVLERRGRPMAMLVSVEEYEQLQARSGAGAKSPVSPLPPDLQRRQALLVKRALELEKRLGDPVTGLAELFSGLPSADDSFWVEIQETQ